MSLGEFFSGVLDGQKEFGHCIAGIINLILLSIVYFVGVGLTSLIAKIFGKSFLDSKIDKDAKTYWSELNLGKKPRGDYFKQF